MAPGIQRAVEKEKMILGMKYRIIVDGVAIGPVLNNETDMEAYKRFAKATCIGAKVSYISWSEANDE